MVERERLREQARLEYEKEKGNVEAVVNQMIAEDQQMAQLTKMKQDQAHKDMITSKMERLAQAERERQIEAHENDMVRRYAEEQAR